MRAAHMGVTLVATAIAAPVLAQAADIPVVGFTWSEFWGAAKAAGLFGTVLLGYVLWRVDKERVEYRIAKDLQTEQYIAQMKLDAVARAKTEELAQKYILGVEAMNAALRDQRGKV